MEPKFNVVLIVPTGVGAKIGGYAGDALPVARTIGAVVDCLITHPNVVNGASLYYPMPNLLYTEGYALNKFAQGKWGLRPVFNNRIGVIFDRGIEPDLLLRHYQVIDGATATLGLTIPHTLVTDQPLGIELRQGVTGATWGTIQNPDSLLRAAGKLLSEAIDALAVVTRFPDDSESQMLQQYRQGAGIDALGGAEAVISHLISREFEVPCAHAPALMPLPLSADVHPRACAEELGYTFLPCVLVGLSRAPQIVSDFSYLKTTDLRSGDVSAVVAPLSCCGSPAILALAAQPLTQLIFVQENKTVLDVLPKDLGIKGTIVNNYLEAVGVLAAIRAGVNPDRLLPTVVIENSAPHSMN